MTRCPLERDAEALERFSAAWRALSEPAPADEIEWGPWEPEREDYYGDMMMRVVGGVVSCSYPVQRKPVVETASWASFLFGTEYRFTVTRIDGVVQDVAKVEALA